MICIGRIGWYQPGDDVTNTPFLCANLRGDKKRRFIAAILRNMCSAIDCGDDAVYYYESRYPQLLRRPLTLEVSSREYPFLAHWRKYGLAEPAYVFDGLSRRYVWQLYCDEIIVVPMPGEFKSLLKVWKLRFAEVVRVMSGLDYHNAVLRVNAKRLASLINLITSHKVRAYCSYENLAVSGEYLERSCFLYSTRGPIFDTYTRIYTNREQDIVKFERSTKRDDTYHLAKLAFQLVVALYGVEEMPPSEYEKLKSR